MSERLRRLVLPALAVLVLFALATATGYVTMDTGASPKALPQAASTPGTRGSIQAVNGTTLTLVTDAGSKQFTLASDVHVESLRPANASSIAVGDWLNAGTMPNAQTLFTIVGLTLIPQALLQPQ